MRVVFYKSNVIPARTFLIFHTMFFRFHILCKITSICKATLYVKANVRLFRTSLHCARQVHGHFVIRSSVFPYDAESAANMHHF